LVPLFHNDGIIVKIAPEDKILIALDASLIANVRRIALASFTIDFRSRNVDPRRGRQSQSQLQLQTVVNGREGKREREYAAERGRFESGRARTLREEESM